MASNDFVTPQPHGPGRRLRGSLTTKLAKDILNGRYAPGERLRSEAEFHRILDVSRGAYREAVKILSAKGLVESHPCAGTKILPRNRWNLLDPDILEWAFLQDQLPRQLILELLELRAIVEPQAARLAAQRVTAPQLQDLSDCVSRMSDGTVSELQTARLNFHEALIFSTRNDAVIRLASSTLCLMRADLKRTDAAGSRQSEIAHYMAVLECLERHIGRGAESAMALLLEFDRRSLGLRWEDRDPN